MRLIDADALRKNAQHAKDISKWDGELLVVGLGHILSAPTIESPRPDWTPCAEGLPVPHHKGQQREMFLVSLETGCVSTMFYEFNPNGYLGEGWSDKILTVLAWQPLPDPYNPDHIRDTTEKVDQFREPTKMMQEERQ